ncbi:MAG: IS110 family transposase [Ignavibacteriaceae bacterium]|jgi:transposase|nr:IS110 family transposase [Ignavibacteriaceae bacterium]
MYEQSINAKYFCGIDLHKDNMFICLIDNMNKIHIHKRIPATYEALHHEIAPFIEDTAVGVESTFNYYWLQDACQKDNLQFYLGHALYMRVGVHKKKDDKLDSYRIAQLMRNGNFPFAYAFPSKFRGLRELLRERLKTVRLRSQHFTRFYIKLLQYSGWSQELSTNPAPNHILRQQYIRSINDQALKVVFQQISDNIDLLDAAINKIEKEARNLTTSYLPKQLKLVTSIPGIGFILGMTILYETDDINRFKSMQNYASYCRVISTQRSSSGKTVDGKNQKSGNTYLKLAYSQGACLAIRHSKEINAYYKKLTKKKGAPKARAIIKHKLAAAVYQILKKNTTFDISLFMKPVKS